MASREHTELIRVLGDIKTILSKIDSNTTTVSSDKTSSDTKDIKESDGEFSKMMSNGVITIIDHLIGRVKEAASAWSDLQDESYKFGRSIGLNKEGLEAFYRSNRYHTRELAKDLGISHKELIGLKQSYVETIGRAQTLTKETVEFMGAMSKFSSADIVNKMSAGIDDLGGSIDTAMSTLGDGYLLANEWGLNTKKNAELIAENIHLASTYTFKNGTDGLVKMVAQAQKLKINMSSIESAAEKFTTLESAISTSAKLQVLGGEFSATFGNPLDMMYDAVMDLESFQNNIVESFRDQGVFNKKTGIVEFDPATKQRIRYAAEALGMSYKEVMTMSNQLVKSEEIEKNLKDKTLSEGEKALITSLSRYDEKLGWVIDTINEDGEKEKTISISELNKQNISEIKKNRTSEEQSFKDIHALRRHFVDKAHETKSFAEMYGGLTDDFKNWMAGAFNGIGNFGQSSIDKMGTLGTMAIGTGVGLFGKPLYDLAKGNIRKVFSGTKGSEGGGEPKTNKNTWKNFGKFLKKGGKWGVIAALAAGAVAYGSKLISDNKSENDKNNTNEHNVNNAPLEDNTILSELEKQTALLNTINQYLVGGYNTNQPNTSYGNVAKYIDESRSSNGTIDAVTTVASFIPYVNLLTSAYDSVTAFKTYSDDISAISKANLSATEEILLENQAKNKKYKDIGTTIGLSVGGVIGAILGSSSGTSGALGTLGAIGGSLFGNWVGDILVKDKKIEDIKPEEIANKLQERFETGKIGSVSISDPQLEIKAYYATVKIHDLLISWFKAVSEKEDYDIDYTDGLNAEQIERYVQQDQNMFAVPLTEQNQMVYAQQVGGDYGNNVYSTPIVGNAEYIKPYYYDQQYSPSPSTMNHSIDINVNGSLRLVSDRGSADIDINKLISSNEFKQKIFDMIQQELLNKQNGGRGIQKDSRYYSSNFTSNHSSTQSI